MSTTQNLSIQVYAPDGTPIPSTVSREHLLDLARGAYERGGTHLTRGDIDIELAEAADKAACSLLRDRWNDDFPIAAYVELLTTVAALRAVLGFDPTPTAREVTDWAEKLGERLGGEIDGPASLSFIKFANGPYKGAVLRVPGAADQGPAAALTLPIAWGDTAEPGHGEARYERDAEATDEGLWLYRLDDETVREDARPHITLTAESDQVGA
ncbi:hypothetical protein ACIBU0_42525 [Streptomyces sp. NPDC049627]|uniref:hypothetical protein n=1 Tax=Streptomyces sp. NPDC049627 TaxID=3365595 RepID=UPI0037A5C6C8